MKSTATPDPAPALTAEGTRGPRGCGRWGRRRRGRAGGRGGFVLIGALAGLLPAIRAARLSPTQALWSI